MLFTACHLSLFHHRRSFFCAVCNIWLSVSTVNSDCWFLFGGLRSSVADTSVRQLKRAKPITVPFLFLGLNGFGKASPISAIIYPRQEPHVGPKLRWWRWKSHFWIALQGPREPRVSPQAHSLFLEMYSWRNNNLRFGKCLLNWRYPETNLGVW